MMKKISATLLIILLLPNLAHSAPKLSKDVEKIANEHFFRLEAIELLYDKEGDYEKAFGCKNAGAQVNGGRTDALCIGPGKILTLVIIKSKTGYPGYVLTCPSGFDEIDPFDIAKTAHKSDPTNFQGKSGNSYYMGRTNGWVQKFENIYITADMGFAKTNCWGLNKR